MTARPMLEVTKLFAGYEPGVPIVRGAGIEVARGEIVAVLGPNGAGKSTLVKAVAGMVPKFSGSVVLDGKEVTRRKPHEMVRAGLAFVPQTENVFATMTVAENLQIGAAVLPKAVRRARIEAMRDLFPDLAQRLKLPAGRLSGGQRQMLAIARALIAEPTLLILDEASAGLSPLLVEVVFAKVREICRRGMTILLVEQNVRAALAISDRAYVLVEGKNRHEGRAGDLLADSTVADLYLGSAREPARLSDRP